jgi:hypothetical protein
LIIRKKVFKFLPDSLAKLSFQRLRPRHAHQHDIALTVSKIFPTIWKKAIALVADGWTCWGQAVVFNAFEGLADKQYV